MGGALKDVRGYRKKKKRKSASSGEAAACSMVLASVFCGIGDVYGYQCDKVIIGVFCGGG
jgi:hypothetical protein